MIETLIQPVELAIAPLLALMGLVGGAGLTSNFFDARKTRQTKARNQGLLAATLKGFPSLTADQQTAATAAGAVDFDTGTDFIKEMAGLNMQRAQLSQQAQHHQENLDIRLQEARGAAARTKAMVAQTDALFDPRQSALRLREKGMVVVDKPGGGQAVRFIEGTPEHATRLSEFRVARDAIGSSSGLIESIDKFGAITDVRDPNAPAQALAYQNLLAGLRMELQQGAPQEFEQRLLERTIANPQSLWNSLVRGEPVARASIVALQEILLRGADRQLLDTQHEDFPNRDRRSMIETLVKATSLRPAPPVAPVEGAQLDPAKVVGSGSRFTNSVLQTLLPLLETLNPPETESERDQAKRRLELLRERGEILSRTRGSSVIGGGAGIEALPSAIGDLL